MSERSKQKDPVVEAIHSLTAVIIFFGLIAAGFYARSHHVDDTLFFLGAILVLLGGGLDRFI